MEAFAWMTSDVICLETYKSVKTVTGLISPKFDESSINIRSIGF